MPNYHQSLLETNLVKREIDPASVAGATNGVGVDMGEAPNAWDGVLFICQIGAGAFTKDFKAQSDTASNFGTAADIANAACTQRAAGITNSIEIIDVYRPTNRFVRSVFTPSGAVLVSVISIRYRATGRLPVTQDATTLQVVKVAQN